MTNKQFAAFQRYNKTVVTFPWVFHDVHAELYSIVGKQFIWHALFRAFAKAMTVDESTIATLSVLQIKLQSNNVHKHTAL